MLDVEPETREPLYQHLDRFIIADDVTLEDATDAIATIAVEGPQAAEVLQRAGAPVPEAEYSSADWGDSLRRASQLHRQLRILPLCASGGKGQR